MRQNLAYVAVFGIGFAISFGLRTGLEFGKARQYAAQRFVEGRHVGVKSMQIEAVREGHGIWVRTGEATPNGFEWLPVREFYNGDRVDEPIPGLSQGG